MSKTKSGLIAMVATAVIVNGNRIVIQPGQELPELPEHDEKELLDSGAALDPEALAASEKARKQEEQFAQQTFQEARERAIAERASIAVDTPADASKDETSASTEAPAQASAPAPAADAPAADPAPQSQASPAAPAADKAPGKAPGKGGKNQAKE